MSVEGILGSIGVRRESSSSIEPLLNAPSGSNERYFSHRFAQRRIVGCKNILFPLPNASLRRGHSRRDRCPCSQKQTYWFATVYSERAHQGVEFEMRGAGILHKNKFSSTSIIAVKRKMSTLSLQSPRWRARKALDRRRNAPESPFENQLLSVSVNKWQASRKSSALRRPFKWFSNNRSSRRASLYVLR
jgi:hypothetical protein